MISIRESIPTEEIIRSYMDESVEQEEEIIIENIEEPLPETRPKGEHDDEFNNVTTSIREQDDIPEIVPTIKDIDNEQVVTRLTFNDIDSVLDKTNVIKSIDAPKSIEKLEEISTSNAMKKGLDEIEENYENKIKIDNQLVDLSDFELLDDDEKHKEIDDVYLNDIEELY
jgi:hypothetical protein